MKNVYKIVSIIEPDFGCEGRPEHMEPMDTLILKSQTDEEIEFKYSDKLLYELEIDEGDFIRIPYKEAMEKYGSDKPDTRFGLELFDVSDIMEASTFEAFKAVIAKGGKACIF